MTYPAQSATRQTDLHRYLTTSTTDAAYAITEGIFTAAQLNALTRPYIPLDGYRGLSELSIFGAGADNSLIDWRLLLVKRIAAPYVRDVGPTSWLYDVKTAVEGTAVLSTLVGVAGNAVINTDRIADSVGALTISTWMNTLATAFGALPTAANPANNTRASLIAPDLGNAAGFLIDLRTNSGTPATNCNALFQLGT